MVKKLNFLALFFIFLVQLSCKQDRRDNFIIIAVDKFPVYNVSCQKENSNKKSGIDILCNDSIRFTHAFTTSTLSNPALSSILTGKYPFQHQVHDNNYPGLSPHLLTSAEIAYKKRYKTSFISGGPPILRKSGLNQGFEFFEDNIKLGSNNFFRKAKDSYDIFKNWYLTEASNSSFYSFFYHPDLGFIDKLNPNDIIEQKGKGFESQLEEFDESLFHFFNFLKSKKIWENTHILLIGLNGQVTGFSRSYNIQPLNLNSENTQIAFFFKPARKQRDEGLQWSIDRNISLCDIGVTLFDLLDVPLKAVSIENNLNCRSFKNLISNKVGDLDERRSIIMESSWGKSRNISSSRVAVLFDNFLIINDSPLRIYNTLADRLELNPLLQNQTPKEILENYNKVASQLGFGAWEIKNQFAIKRLTLPYLLWKAPENYRMLIKELIKLSDYYKKDPILPEWIATIALELKDWDKLKTIGKITKNKDWIYVAEKNLFPNKKIEPDNECLKLLMQKNLFTQKLKSCNDENFVSFIQWAKSDHLALNKDIERKKLEKIFNQILIQQEIHKTNIALNEVWDLDSVQKLKPQLIELALSLPEYQKYRPTLIKNKNNEEELDAFF